MLKLKKVVSVIIVILQIALLAGAYIFHYFTIKKQGMNRFVNFYNMKWNKAYPMEVLKFAVVAIILIATVLLLMYVIKKKEEINLNVKGSVVGMTVLSFVYIVFTLWMGLDKLRAYYFISLMLALAAVLQIGKTALRIKGVL